MSEVWFAVKFLFGSIVLFAFGLFLYIGVRILWDVYVKGINLFQ